MARLLVLNGPNLNMLGIREPEKYGNKNLEMIAGECVRKAESLGYKLKHFQSNTEGDLVGFIQKEGTESSGMILNAGAYTHTSVAIRDAILSVKIPFVEVHLSNVFARESFRHQSYLSDIAIGVITGFGENSYYLGIEAIDGYLEKLK